MTGCHATLGDSAARGAGPSLLWMEALGASKPSQHGIPFVRSNLIRWIQAVRFEFSCRSFPEVHWIFVSKSWKGDG